MSLQSGQAKLTRAMKELNARWGSVRPVWRDEVGRRFEAEHIVPLEQKVRAATGAMSRMSELLHRIRRDCE